MKMLRTHRWSAFLAIWLLLLGTAAPALERLSCSMGCPTTIGIGSIEDCCGDEHPDHGSAISADDCCEVERAAPEHHAFTSENTTIHLELLLSNAPERNRLSASSITDPPPGYDLCVRPPPLLTGERLSLVRSFLI